MKTTLLMMFWAVLLVTAPIFATQAQEMEGSEVSQENNGSFFLGDTISGITAVPELVRDSSDASPLSFIQSPLAWAYVLVMYILAFAFGFFYRWLLKTFAKGSVRGVSSNIGKYDRAIRYAFWLGLLVWAITTSWSPWLLFFSGFALFEALFSWCGLYAALGRNTCPS